MSNAPQKKIDVDNTEASNDEQSEVQTIRTFRRVLPQLFGSLAKNFMIINIGEFNGLPSIVIPSLTGVGSSLLLNPDETVRISAAQASWLSCLTHIIHPIGSLLSGPINDKIGRRKTIMLVNIPLVICWICLGCSQSFLSICMLLMILGFSFGLKEAPAFTYISEISEPSLRGIMMAMNTLSFNAGTLIVAGFGSILRWRYVAFLCAIAPICCLTAILFIPESPSWLLSNGRTNDAHKSLQWLRGWVTPQTVQKEFVALENYSNTSNACASCAKQAINCSHPRPTICDKLKEIKRKRNIRPLVLIICFKVFDGFSGSTVLEPYIIQVFTAFGSPVDASEANFLISIVGVCGSIFLMFTVKMLGRRKIYLTATMCTSVCSVILSAYGFTFFPLGWISFKRDPNEPSLDPLIIRDMVGSFGYLMLFAMLAMRFFTKMGIQSMSVLYVGEIFPFKSRSFLCGISVAVDYLVGSFSTKVYYNIEMWLSLPGANLFYGIFSFIGFITMYFIMPETERRSLEDIELHYSDNSKGITDIHIPKNAKRTFTVMDEEYLKLDLIDC